MRLRRTLRDAHPPDDEFWRRLPIDRQDADSHDGGRAAMATGWSLCTRTGLTADALALLREGFATWRSGASCEPAVARRFLEQLLAELIEQYPAPAQPPSPPTNTAVDALVHTEASGWVVSELLALGVEPVMERMLYGFITLAELMHVPSGTTAWAWDYAARHDLPAPWL